MGSTLEARLACWPVVAVGWMGTVARRAGQAEEGVAKQGARPADGQAEEGGARGGQAGLGPVPQAGQGFRPLHLQLGGQGHQLGRQLAARTAVDSGLADGYVLRPRTRFERAITCGSERRRRAAAPR